MTFNHIQSFYCTTNTFFCTIFILRKKIPDYIRYKTPKKTTIFTHTHKDTIFKINIDGDDDDRNDDGEWAKKNQFHQYNTRLALDDHQKEFLPLQIHESCKPNAIAANNNKKNQKEKKCKEDQKKCTCTERKKIIYINLKFKS